MRRMRTTVWTAAIALTVAIAGQAGAQNDFVNFESGHVRPLALSPDGSKLFAVNTPDNRLAIYDVTAGGLTLAAEVPVGLEPVAVAARSNTEVWVVNHLSDSVSIVSVNAATPSLSRVTRTLLTCDEPRDIVFAGPTGNRAFISTTRRGQNCASVASLTGVTNRALVQVFDATNLGTGIGGTPIANVQLFGDTPRALARTADGSTVYAAVFESGNRTTCVNETAMGIGGGLPPMPPGSTPNWPSTGLIVKWNGSAFVDELNRSWNGAINYRLPDQDVFLIDANAATPALFASNNNVTGVGTVLFNMAVRPSNGRVYVSNTEARNHVRFEPRISATQGVQGHISESRITTIAGTAATPRHLNPHLDATRSCVPPGCISPQSERDATLAFPTAMVFSADAGSSLVYVAGFGSGKIGIYDASALESGVISKTLVPVGQGPSGLALDAANDRLYVMNRISHDISIVSNASTPASAAETGVVALRFDPSSPAARDGRVFLYDAAGTSGHGDSACASCHIFGDFDGLAWDLGDPFGPVVQNTNPFRVGVATPQFHPLKGPMTTQSLRGMADAGPMHWRGDRTGGGANALDEELAFAAFNPAFVGLLGRASQLTPAEMQMFTDFILTVRYPPNPIRALDDAPTAAQADGENLFLTNPTDQGVITCEFCHKMPLGTDGLMSFEGEPQEFKIAHLRNLYQKVGLFRTSANQVRGFGFLHDGSVVSVFEFVSSGVFQNMDNTQRRNVESFLLAFDTGLAPIVGQQVTATTPSNASVNARINLMIARADLGDCDLVVKGNRAGEARGAEYVGGGSFRFDRNDDALSSLATVLGFTGTAGQEMTFSCVPPAAGERIGIDRDRDGAFDRTELDCGTDPADPSSVPAAGCGGVTTTTTTTSSTTSTVASVCGNGVREAGEQCDGTQFGGQSCPAGSAAGAFLTCNGNCTVDFSHCFTTTTTSTSSTTSTSVGGSTSTSSTVSSSSTTSSTLPGPSSIPVATRTLKMRDGSQVADPSRRSFTFKVRTTDAAPANRVLAPARGSAADPTLHGLQVTVFNGNGSGETAVLALPPGPQWTALGTPSNPKGYRYKGLATDTVRKVMVKNDQIKVTAKGAGFGYSLDEPQQGSIAVRVTAGGQVTWCGLSAGQPGFDVQDGFRGVQDSPAPASCPPAP